MKLVVILSFAAIALACVVSTSAIAQENDYLCYWRNPDGTTRDLSSLCQKPSQTKRSPDGAFVADFRAMASRYPDNIRQSLDSYINQNRDSAIASAQVTCRVLRFGGIKAQSTRRQALASDASSPGDAARQQIIQSLAVNQYCPEFASRWLSKAKN